MAGSGDKGASDSGRGAGRLPAGAFSTDTEKREYDYYYDLNKKK